MTARAHYRIEDRQLGRVAEADAEAVVVIADKVYVAADQSQAWLSFMAFAEWLCEHLQPSARWRAAHIALAHGRCADVDDRRTNVGLDQLTSATQMLALVREVLGDDAYAKLRAEAVKRMLGQ